MSDLTIVGNFDGSLTPTLFESTAGLERVRTATYTAGQDKILRAAQDFEAMLLAQWLEQAREAFAGVPGGDDSEEDELGTGQMMSLGMESLASAVAKAGGVGIARLVARNLARNHHDQEVGNIPASTG